MTTAVSRSIIKKLVTITLSFAVIVSGFILFIPDAADAAPSTELVDSGIDYSDGIEKAATKDPNTGETVMVDALHMNPHRGIHTWAADLVLKNSDDPGVNKAVEPYLAATMKERSLGYFAVDISDFSGAYHLDGDGRGPDAELTESALTALDQTLKNFKKNNMQVIIRFVYDKGNDSIEPGEGWINENGKSVVEARQSMILTHIGQIAEVLNANADTILTVQIGFYGHYGELHGSPMCSKNNFKGALNAMLEATRESGLRVSMRTPSKLAYYLDYDISKSAELDEFVQTVTKGDEDAYRAAIFNDGYLGSDSDLGTYYNREKETGWMATQNLHNPYGGDLVPDPNTGKATVEAQQPKVLKEMAKVRTSYFAPDSRVQTYWEGELYDGSLYDGDAYAKNDSEYKGQSLWTYIENHIGYRFVLRESMLPEAVKAGGTLENTFKIENVGFGNLFYPMQSYAYITDEYGKVVVGPTKVDVDPTSFEINETTSGSMDIPIPDDMEPGKYNLYLQFKIGDREVDGTSKPYGAIRLANSNIWNEGLEANYLGSFKVNREVKIIKKWEDRSYIDARPNSLTFTIEKKTRLPFEYQEVEYIEADGTQWIDTGVDSDASHTIYSEGSARSGKASGLLQSYVDQSNRLGYKLYGESKKFGCYWRIDGNGQVNKEISTENLGGIDVTEKLQVTQSATELVIKQGNLTKTVSLTGVATGSTGGNWRIFKSNENESHGVLCEAKIIDSSGLIHHYIPCYRKSDDEIGVYDVIAESFLTNSGTGTFKKGDDVSFESEEITIPKDRWTQKGNTWETAVPTEHFSGYLLIHEADVVNYNSDADADHKKTIGSDNTVEITNTIKDEAIPKPGSDPNQKGVDGTPTGKGASAAAAEAAITSSSSDEGPAGSRFVPLALKSTKQTGNSIRLNWNSVHGATNYVVYGNACGKKNKMKKLGVTNAKSFNVKKISASLKKGKYHKFMVVALDENRNVVTTSKVVHVATKGGKVKNPTKVTVKSSVIKKAKKLKAGKKLKLKAKQKGKKVKKHRKICYESTNPAIATVSGGGQINAKKKGSCYIYAYAQNGIARKIKAVIK